MTTMTNGLHLYFRTRREDVIEARKVDMMQNAFVEGRGQAFADQFGAVPLFTRGFVAHLAGITFTPEKPCHHPELWTKKTATEVLQRPRKAVAKRLEPQLIALRAKWLEAQPLEVMRPQASKVLEVLGVTPERITEEKATMTYYERMVDGERTVFISATMLLEGLDEIVGTEFLQASNLPPIGV